MRIAFTKNGDIWKLKSNTDFRLLEVVDVNIQHVLLRDLKDRKIFLLKNDKTAINNFVDTFELTKV